MVIKTEVLIKDNKQKYRRAYDKIKFQKNEKNECNKQKVLEKAKPR